MLHLVLQLAVLLVVPGEVAQYQLLADHQDADQGGAGDNEQQPQLPVVAAGGLGLVLNFNVILGYQQAQVATLPLK